MINRLFLFLPIIFFTVTTGNSQQFQSGFDKEEYIELLKLTAKHTDPEHFKDVPYPEHFTLEYRSPIVGLENAWELWVSPDSIAAISIRGTTENTLSWLANFYAAMVPAKGELKLASNDTFTYELAQNPNAAVHVGWLLSTAFLSKTIIPKIESSYRAGIKDFFVIGHSQGGAIAFLITAHLYSLQRQEKLPSDIKFKTYSSAGPKPGNLYFAYEYEAKTQEGWAYNVVSPSDWVPELPFSVQTTDDFTEVNPFRFAKGMIKKQKFPKNIVLSHMYNKMDKASKRTQRKYQKYLGDMISDYVKKNIENFEPPTYFQSNNYVRTGHTIILLGDEDYFGQFPLERDNLFRHHYPDAYLFLSNKLPAQPHLKFEAITVRP